jgi:hypothetical protein
MGIDGWEIQKQEQEQGPLEFDSAPEPSEKDQERWAEEREENLRARLERNRQWPLHPDYTLPFNPIDADVIGDPDQEEEER